MDRDERAELVVMPNRTLVIVKEALALRNSHPQAPTLDLLDLVMRDREYWLEHFVDHMMPPAPFALLVAEAVDDCISAADWIGLTGPTADPRVRDALVQMYRESVWPKFVQRYGWSPPRAEPRRVSDCVRWP
jgi:hypothetical protein